MSFNINISGEFLYDKVVSDYSSAANIATRAVAEALLTEANKTAPKDEGLLIQSGKVDYDATEKAAYISYDTPYAVRLHEHPEYNFQNGRRGKWLELTMFERKNMLEALFASKMRDNLNNGGGA